MEKIRKTIRKQLFEILGATSVNDPSAPWNQSEPKFIDEKKPKENQFKVIFFNKEITILQDVKDKSKWFFYNESASNDDYFPYSGAEDLSQFSGNDEEGEPTFDEEYGEWDLTGQIVQDYINDNLQHLTKGAGVDDYENAIQLVKIDRPLAIELENTFKDENLKKVLAIL